MSSPYFHSLFFGSFVEKTKKEVELHDIDQKVFSFIQNISDIEIMLRNSTIFWMWSTSRPPNPSTVFLNHLFLLKHHETRWMAFHWLLFKSEFESLKWRACSRCPISSMWRYLFSPILYWMHLVTTQWNRTRINYCDRKFADYVKHSWCRTTALSIRASFCSSLINSVSVRSWSAHILIFIVHFWKF